MATRTRGFEIINGYECIEIPCRKTTQSAGYDLAAANDCVLESGAVVLVPTGLKAYMPSGEYLSIHIRSSMAVKHGLSLINGQGIIDADYYNNPENEGHILIAVYNHSPNPYYLGKGTRIAQGIFMPYLVADNDIVQGTRRGGIGSTGQK